MIIVSIVGANVKHKTFGNGTIIGQKDSFISVQFSSLNNAKKIASFQFPDVFSNNFLTPADDESASIINRFMQERKCNFCEKLHSQTELIDGKWYCPYCKRKYTMPCSLCGSSHIQSELEFVYNPSQRIPLCKTCSEKYSFVCERCGIRYLSKDNVIPKLDGKLLCANCFDEAASTCHFCGSTFYLDDGKEFYLNNYENYISVCPQCIPFHTFTCSVCGHQQLNEMRVNSKYIPASKRICQKCVLKCSKCGEELSKNQAHFSFEKTFCPTCWQNYKSICPYCKTEFIPESPRSTICPDCANAETYVARLKQVDFQNRAYKRIKYYSLETMDRCELFTQLYVHCEELEGHKFNTKSCESPYHFLVIKMLGHNLVVTYLQPNIIGTVKYLQNITMTEFRSKKGRHAVHNAVYTWATVSNHFMETSAGKMKILNYPILLRVQTSYDKVYGKEWRGPYDYIEIGNYGNTTSFYIIGLL